MTQAHSAKVQNESNTEHRNQRERIGIVVRDKMEKTAVVEVERRAPHAVYGKIVKSRVRYKAHNEKNLAKTGDRVRIVESRPLSKTKRWRIAEILKK